MNKAVNYKFGYSTGEIFYSKIERKIVIEDYIDAGEDGLSDYKLHCFNDNGEFTIFIQVDTGRFTDHKRSLYDSEWNLLEYSLKKFTLSPPVDKPEKLTEMLEVAKKLATPFDYVRVDLYYHNGQIYFGEITQTHGGGKANFSEKKYDDEWGALWKMNRSDQSLYRQ